MCSFSPGFSPGRASGAHGCLLGSGSGALVQKLWVRRRRLPTNCERGRGTAEHGTPAWTLLVVSGGRRAGRAPPGAGIPGDLGSDPGRGTALVEESHEAKRLAGFLYLHFILWLRPRPSRRGLLGWRERGPLARVGPHTLSGFWLFQDAFRVLFGLSMA